MSRGGESAPDLPLLPRVRRSFGCPEGEDGDLWPTEKADVWREHTEALVGVQEHTVQLVEPTGITPAVRGQVRRTDEGKPHLPAVRVAGEL